MALETSILLHVFLWAIGLLAIAGFASAWAGRWSERLSVGLGAGGAGAACAVGLGSAAVALATRAEGTLALPWNMPYGTFAIGLDPLSSFFLLPMFLLSGLAGIYAIGYFKPWSGRNPGRFWLFYDLLIASMALVLTARNGVLFLVAWEAMTLASFFLVTFDDADAGVGEAGWVYLGATHVGTAFLLALFILLGRASGTQDFASYAVPAGSAGTLFLLAVIGFGTKAGLFPFHVWLPEAHPAAPSPVSAVMSGVMIKTGIYGIVRALVLLGAVPGWCGWAVLAIGAVSGVLGVLFALAQHDLKRLLAYHSVENVGIIALGLGIGMLGVQAGSPVVAALGFAGGLLHVLNHALFKGLLFLGAGAVVHGAGTRHLERLGGLLKRMPWTGATFLVGSVAICGLPPFNGFASEFLVYAGSFKSILSSGAAALGGVLAVVALALIGGLAAACFAKAFGIVFLGEPRTAVAAAAHEVDGTMRGPMLILAALCLAIGMGAGAVVRFMEPAVAALTGAEAGPTAADWLSPIAAVAAGLIAATAALALIRRRLLAGRSRRETVTWDCGYAAPTARMQYTATGFVQPLTHDAASLLQPHLEQRLPEGIFPAAASLHDETPDLARERLYDPIFRGLARGLGWVHKLQQGQVHWYVLYVVATVLVLLTWALRS